jgi:uncharacterized membrane protein YqhA
MVNSRSKLEIGVERVLFGSRWILAPFYLGMVLALLLILVAFVRTLFTDIDGPRLRWMVVIHLTFVVSGVLMALMDWIASKAEKHVPSER